MSLVRWHAALPLYMVLSCPYACGRSDEPREQTTMTVDSHAISQLLEREAAAARGTTEEDYDRTVCLWLDELDAMPASEQRTQALLALAARSLRRSLSLVTESRAKLAERLLEQLGGSSSSRVELLLMLAWSRLGATVADGPASIDVSPELPLSAALPSGASPADILDPALRAQAEAAAEEHRAQVARWNAKQRATHHLERIALLVEKHEPPATKELLAALALAPGLPRHVASALAKAAE